MPSNVRNPNASTIVGGDQSFRMQPPKELDFIEKVLFDQQLRFIIAYGKTQFMLYNLEYDITRVYSIDRNIYEQIHDIAFSSTSNDQFTCCLAVKRRIVYQIVVFDYFATRKHVRFD
jgi:hypothetical protein